MATTFKDYYEILGVPKSATEKDIKAAFRKLARKYHPDVNPNDKSAEDRFKEINEANEVLGDPEKRKKYDELGPQWQQYEAWERAGKPGPNPFGGGGGVEYRTVSPEDLEELFGSDDPFSSFFHDVFGRSAAGSRRQPVSRRGDDVEGDVTISLAEAYTGCTRTIELSTPEPRPYSALTPVVASRNSWMASGGGSSRPLPRW